MWDDVGDFIAYSIVVKLYYVVVILGEEVTLVDALVV